uniref:NADH dehydrogenase subunit 6 n=1 Tax=Halicephalobus gingivalis TaxID=114868 RepID=A0A0H3V335_9BILA|nr:NADH dehydrogenase subunit 6 [Halicephalobus gingivalis]
MFFSLLMSFLCYLNIDPMKSCLYLVFSLIFISPFLSFGLQIWYSYFICLIFLSGIFVILVYFSSLSKYNFFKFSLSILIFFSFFFVGYFYVFHYNFNLFSLYFFNYFLLFLWVIFSLLLFMNFTSYFMNFSGALRKL